MEETTEIRSFAKYREENKGKMSPLAIEATWLALKGVCTVKEVNGMTRIDKVTDKYPVYMKILDAYRREYRLSPDEIAQRYTDLRKYAMMKFGRSLSAN